MPSGQGERLPHVDRSCEIIVESKKEWKFPLKEAYDRLSTTVRGMTFSSDERGDRVDDAHERFADQDNESTPIDLDDVYVRAD